MPMPMPDLQDMTHYETDKSSLYLSNYQRYFSNLVDRHVALLELGINRGGSLLLWRDYFKSGTIVGLDCEHCHIEDPEGRLHVYQGYQQDCALLDRIRRERAPKGFDIIIDDASHLGRLTRISFWHLFQHHLKPGGIYVIEDWRTGYWDEYPDGKRYRPARDRSFLIGPLRDWAAPRRTLAHEALTRLLMRRRFPSHCYGMVGFIKELVDELGVDMITSPMRGSRQAQRLPRFRSLEVTPGQVFITKANDSDNALVTAQLGD